MEWTVEEIRLKNATCKQSATNRPFEAQRAHRPAVHGGCIFRPHTVHTARLHIVHTPRLPTVIDTRNRAYIPP